MGSGCEISRSPPSRPPANHTPRGTRVSADCPTPSAEFGDRRRSRQSQRCTRAYLTHTRVVRTYAKIALAYAAETQDAVRRRFRAVRPRRREGGAEEEDRPYEARSGNEDAFRHHERRVRQGRQGREGKQGRQASCENGTHLGGPQMFS